MKSSKQLKILFIATLFAGLGLIQSSFFAQAASLAVDQGSGIIILSGTPGVPNGLKAQSSALVTTIDLRWDAVLGADYYVIYRSENNYFAGLIPVGRTLIATTTYTDTGTPSTTYYYKVAAVNSRGEGYNSAVASAKVCESVGSMGMPTEAGSSIERGRGTGSSPAPTQSPVPSASFCPGFTGGSIGSEISPQMPVPSKPSLLTPSNLASKIVFKNLPSDKVLISPGTKLNFDYSWTNKLDKGTLKNPNKKFLIRRRLWDSNGTKVVEKTGTYLISLGKTHAVPVRELLSKKLPAGIYTMEVEILHYTPYKDEEDIVVDKNSFDLHVLTTPPGVLINPPPLGY